MTDRAPRLLRRVGCRLAAEAAVKCWEESCGKVQAAVAAARAAAAAETEAAGVSAAESEPEDMEVVETAAPMVEVQAAA